MMREEDIMAENLVRIFENVLLTEEKSLSQGYFSDLSIAEMHTLTAIGPYEAKTMRDEKDKRVVRISLTRNGKLACRMHSKFHRVLAKRILEPYEEEDRSKLIKLVEEIDTYIATQLRRYDESDSIRKTAKEVAMESRRSVEKNG